jgi:hypothetical protein
MFLSPEGVDMVLKALLLILLAGALSPTPGLAQGGDPEAPSAEAPPYLRDRGPGIASSMFGTYIERGQWLVYPFFEYYRDGDAEYAPDEFGYEGEEDYRGKYRAQEFLIFLGYGVSDRLALELEAAVIDAKLETAPEDPSEVPDEIEESGLGDVEGQLRFRCWAENERRPEIFSYFEYVLPLQKDKDLIGTQDWEFKLGFGFIKGFGFGTTTFRLAGEYARDESKFELGEYAIEYLRRLSPIWRVFAAVEGSEDEVELIPEVQARLNRRMTLKLNSAFGLTSKATDWAPEIGLLFTF